MSTGVYQSREECCDYFLSKSLFLPLWVKSTQLCKTYYSTECKRYKKMWNNLQCSHHRGLRFDKFNEVKQSPSLQPEKGLAVMSSLQHLITFLALHYQVAQRSQRLLGDSCKSHTDRTPPAAGVCAPAVHIPKCVSPERETQIDTKAEGEQQQL